MKRDLADRAASLLATVGGTVDLRLDRHDGATFVLWHVDEPEFEICRIDEGLMEQLLGAGVLGAVCGLIARRVASARREGRRWGEATMHARAVSMLATLEPAQLRSGR